MLKIYNSLTKQKEPFKPIQKNKVNLYVCGITVYDYCHIGHARTMMVFDIVVRYLRACGYAVTYARNITDIDDKIIKRAHEAKISCDELTQTYIQALHDDVRALGLLAPDREPRATQHMADIIHMIQQLVDNQHAYIASNGDVYYQVAKFADYGKLAHKDIAGLRAGARVEVVDAKQDPLDFVLWKLAKPDEPSWNSPWGAGRPGWHIECSAMATKCLGQNFDIHGGGFDLQFPHHENEVAQAEAATQTKFVNTWMHVGFVTINKEKMSKSLGNFFTIREVLAKYPAEVVRYFMLSSHYRSPIRYAPESLDLAYAALQRLYTALRGLNIAAKPQGSEFETQFHTAMQDDFNTPQAFAVLFDIAHAIQRLRTPDPTKVNALGGLLLELGNVLGILREDQETFMHRGTSANEKAKIDQLIQKREAARQTKDWQEADAIRDQLTALGVLLEDTPNGTEWRHKG